MGKPQEVDFVTFDIFDTLLHRKIWAPADVFECVRLKAYEDEQSLVMHDLLADFAYDRIEAEKRSRANRVKEHGGEGEITFDEIYEQYVQLTGCSTNFAQLLKNIELEVEYNMLTPSVKGLELYNKYHNAGKKIAFISDMYLPSAWLLKTLEDKGFIGASQWPLLVSCEHRASKHTGQLYAIAKERLKIPENSRWLHIGDNRHADIAAAQNHGIQTLHADWAEIDNRFIPVPGTGATHIVAKIIAFLETKQASQYIPADDLEAIGYKVFGPLLFGFNTWLTKACKDNNLNDMVFVARDGWLLKTLFEKGQALCGLSNVRTHYFHMSRKVGYLAGIREWDTNLNYCFIGGKIPRSVSKMLSNANIKAQQRRHTLSAFGLNDINAPKPDYEHFQVKQALDTMFHHSLSTSKTNRDEYKQYFDILPKSEAPIGLVDIGWAGNIQKAFAHAMDNSFTRDRIHGLYLGTLWSSNQISNKGFRLSGWLCNCGAPHHWEQNLTSGGVELLEFLLTADHGSTLGLKKDDNGEIRPVMEELSEAESPYREKALRVQAGVLKFFDDYSFLLSIYDPGTLVSTEWTKPFERLVTNPNDLELQELASLTHSDTPGSNNERLPLASRQPFKTRIRKRKLKRAREQAFWKAAFDKLNKKKLSF